MEKILVHFGCGMEVGPSWENIDASLVLRYEKIPILGKLYKKNKTRFPPQVKYGNITSPGLYEENSVDAFFGSHVLEHLPYETMQKTLENIYLMLKPGGVFRLIVPDLYKRAKLYIEEYEKNIKGAGNSFISSTGLGRKESLKSLSSKMVALFGHSTHHWMYDDLSMQAELKEANFRNIHVCKFGDSKIPEFSEIEDIGRFEIPLGPEVALECKK